MSLSPVESRRVRLVSANGKHSFGEVQIVVWDRASQLMRALKFLGLCWALGVVSVLIPLAHFVLVPAFLIAGPVGAFILSSQKSAVLGGNGVCPECGAPFLIIRCADHWPLKDLCTKCQNTVEIEVFS